MVFCSLNGVFLGTGSKTAFYAFRLKKLGQLPGEPDLRLLYKKDGLATTLYIELKIKPNKLTSEQADCMFRLRELGFAAEVVYSMEEFLKLIPKYDIPCLTAK